MLLLLLQVCAVLEAPGGLGHCGNRLASPLTARLAGPTGVGPWSISEAQTWRLSCTVVSRVLLTTAFLMSSSHTSQRTQIPDRKLVEKGRGREWKGLNQTPLLGSQLLSGFLEMTSSRQALGLGKAWFIF